MKDKLVYVAIGTDEIRKNSASGGVFTELAKKFIDDGGVVYGAALIKECDDFIVKHIRVIDYKGLEKLQGSKYVQSIIGDSITYAIKDLEEGRNVLFSGTPCQINAIKKLTKKSTRAQLYTVDLICHGVPSFLLFNDYLHYLENKNKYRINSFVFRDKEVGWGLNGKLCFVRDNLHCNVIIPDHKSSYYKLFLDNSTYRESCYQCKYASDRRPGDITIGDFWGAEVECPELLKNKIDINKGVSCIIVNTECGSELIDNFGCNLLLYPSNIQKVKKHNFQLVNPSKRPKDRNFIYFLNSKYGYHFVELYFYMKNWKHFLRIMLGKYKRYLFDCLNRRYKKGR